MVIYSTWNKCFFFLIWLYILSLKYLSQGIHFSLWGKVSWYFLVCCFVWFCCLHAKSRADGFKYSVFCLVTKSADFQILGLSHVWVVRFKFLVLFLCGFFFAWCSKISVMSLWMCCPAFLQPNGYILTPWLWLGLLNPNNSGKCRLYFIPLIQVDQLVWWNEMIDHLIHLFIKVIGAYNALQR